jgi:site-specific DNA recombinase
MIAERTRDKMSAARRKGKWVGGNLVLGYDVCPQGGSLIVNEEEARRVREIFSLYLDYGSLMPVIEELDRRAWRMKRWTTREGRTVGGKPFTKNRLHNLLTNIIYTGRVNYQGHIYPGEHPGVIETETWNHVQELLKRNGRSGGRQMRGKYGAILKGILRCGSCGVGMVHTYTRKGSRLYRYYVCVNAHQKGWNNCQTRSVSAPEIELAVVEQIRGIGSNPMMLHAVLRQLDQRRREQSAGLENEKASAERELRRLSQEVAGLVAAAGGKGASTRVATDRLAESNERMAVLNRRLAEIQRNLGRVDEQAPAPSEVEQVLGSFEPLWSQMTPREQEHFVKTIIE